MLANRLIGCNIGFSFFQDDALATMGSIFWDMIFKHVYVPLFHIIIVDDGAFLYILFRIHDWHFRIILLILCPFLFDALDGGSELFGGHAASEERRGGCCK